MSNKKEEKNVIATTRQFERIKIIHEHIKNLKYPNVPRLIEIVNAQANTKEEETSEPTINRDIKLMKEKYQALIKYNRIKNGYFYETDYNLPLFSNVSSDQMTILSSAKTLLSHYEGTPLYNDALSLLDYFQVVLSRKIILFLTVLHLHLLQKSILIRQSGIKSHKPLEKI